MDGTKSFEELEKISPEEAERLPPGEKGVWNLARTRQLTQQLLEQNLHPLMSRAFISYRWGTPEENAWVKGLSDDIKARGWEVVLDQDLQQDSEQELPVPEVISQIATCARFVPIITERYCERIMPDPATGRIKDGWAWDEWNLAISLSKAHRLEFTGILRSGNTIPEPSSIETIGDYRADANYHKELERDFPEVVHSFKPDCPMSPKDFLAAMKRDMEEAKR